jgi:beta-phosphoglucomutase
MNPANPAVVFDFDGVLVDSERVHLRAFQRALGERGWTLDERDYFDRYLGFTDYDLIAAYAAHRDLPLDAASLAALLRRKSEIIDAEFEAGDALFPGARACIARLGAVFPLAIASGSLRREITGVLDRAGLTPAFRAIAGADDVSEGKPAPDLYLAAAARLDVAPASCVAIEDSPWGLDSAASAGMISIAVTTSYPAARLGRAALIVTSLDEIDVETIRRVRS